MALSRYLVPDDYTLEELRREYQQTDAKGRIQLLKRLYDEKSGRVPLPMFTTFTKTGNC